MTDTRGDSDRQPVRVTRRRTSYGRVLAIALAVAGVAFFALSGGYATVMLLSVRAVMFSVVGVVVGAVTVLGTVLLARPFLAAGPKFHVPDNGTLMVIAFLGFVLPVLGELVAIISYPL